MADGLVQNSTGWTVFPLQTSGGRPVLVRSSLGDPDVNAFAAANVLVRLRCSLAEAGLNPAGMPADAEPLNAFEDELSDALESSGSMQSQLIVVVTGNGSRDFYYSVCDEGRQLLGALNGISKDRGFDIKPTRIDESKPQLLRAFTPGMAPQPR